MSVHKTRKPVLVFPEYHPRTKMTPLEEKIIKRQEVIIKTLNLDLQIITDNYVCDRKALLHRALKGEFGPIYEITSGKLTNFGYELFRTCNKINSDPEIDDETRKIATKILRLISDIGNEVVL